MVERQDVERLVDIRGSSRFLLELSIAANQVVS